MILSNRVDMQNLMKWLVIVGAPLIYFMLSFPFTGPAYLSDEIGYLAKAAFLAGYSVDGASPYHGGYSIILAPLFVFFSEPGYIWKGALFLNALMWGGGFYILNLLLDRFGCDISSKRKLFVLFLAALYPSWAVMTGYTFPHPFFSLVYLASVLLFLNWETGSVKSLLPHSFCVGFLYWIHPTGLGPIISSVAVVGVLAVYYRNFRAFFIHTGVVLILVLLYQKGFHEWMAAGMTMPGASSSDTYLGVSPNLNQLSRLGFWLEWASKAMGQFSYLIVGSFGLIVFGVISVWKAMHASITSTSPGRDVPLASAGAYALLSMLAVLLIGSLMFTTTASNGVHHWIYGRYVDATALPIIALGAYTLLALEKNERVFVAAGAGMFVLLCGIALASLAGDAKINNYVNIPAFYPQYLFDAPDFARWMSMGALGVLAAAYLGKYVAVALVIISFVVSTAEQGKWHKNILFNHSTPTTVIELIKSNYSSGSCVGVDDQPNGTFGSVSRAQRFGLYRFLLLGYDYRRMSLGEWSESCNGPYLTYDPGPAFDDPRFEVVARENGFGLFVVTKRGAKKMDLPDAVFGLGGAVFAERAGSACMRSGCFSVSPEELRSYSHAGVVEKNKLVASNRSGYAFFGPYFPLQKGKYSLILYGDFQNADGAVLDIISHNPDRTHYVSTMCSLGCPTGEPSTVPFDLDADVKSLEIRLRVAEDHEFSLSGYEIVARPDGLDPKQPVVAVYGKRLADLPRQVGTFDGRELRTNGKAGYLAYGPYVRIPEGVYEFKLLGSSGNTDSAFVEIRSPQSDISYKTMRLEATRNEMGTLASGLVQWPGAPDQVEVRIGVGVGDEINVRGYQLVPVANPVRSNMAVEIGAER